MSNEPEAPSELEPGAADPAALSRFHRGEAPAPEGAPDEPEPSIGGEPASQFTERRQAEVDHDHLRSIMGDPDASLREKRDAREALLASVGMGQPVEEGPDQDDRAAGWNVSLNEDGQHVQSGPPEELGELPAGDFTANAPEDEPALQERLDAVMDAAPKFARWFKGAEQEQQVVAASTARNLVSAGAPPKLVADLFERQHELNDTIGQLGQLDEKQRASKLKTRHIASWQSLQMKYGAQGASQRIREARAVVRSLPSGMVDQFESMLDETGLGSDPTTVEILSRFYREGA